MKPYFTRWRLVMAAAALLSLAFVFSRATGAVFPTGDFDGDGEVRLSDAVGLLRVVVGLESVLREEIERIDFDADGRAGTGDVIVALHILTGLRPFVPQPETANENQAVTWGEIGLATGKAELWGVWDGPDGFGVARSDGTTIRLDRVATTGGVTAGAGEIVCLTGNLGADAYGRPTLADARIIRRRPPSNLTAILGLPILSKAVASIDLGPFSYPSYVEATSVATTAPGWQAEVEAALRDANPLSSGVTPDGRVYATVFRGPRLPPEKGIVFRYLRVCCVVDLEKSRLVRVLVDVEGWVEE